MTTLESIELESGPEPTASVIWMHGLGADGNDFVPIVDQMNLARAAPIRFVFPHADAIAVTINGGYVMRAWYDILAPGTIPAEDEIGLVRSQAQIEALIAHENARGIPASRIVLAGFSQGAAMTLLTGLRHAERLAGLACLSGYLPLATHTAAQRHAANANVPVFMAHGRQDAVIQIARALASRAALEQLGYSIDWHEYPMPHSVCADEIRDLGHWFERILPA